MTPRRLTALLLGVWTVSTAVFLVWFEVSDLEPTGDEPAYLQMAQSLLLDGDLDLRADQDDPLRAGAILPGFDRLVVDGGDFRGDGRVRPVYPPGTALLVAPAVAIGRALDVSIVTTARIEMAALAGAASVLLAILAWELAGGSGRQAAMAWLAVVLCVPLLPFATQVYPEVPALVAILSALLALRRRASVRTGLVVGLAVAVLPWLQIRYAAIAVGLGAAFMVRWVRERPHPGRAPLAALLAPAVLSWAVVALYNQHLYGDWKPNAAYSLREPPPFWSTLWNEGVGNFLSASSGWFPFAPIAILGVAACVAAAAARRMGPVGLAVGAGYVAYVVGVGATSWAGGTLPARFLAVAAPAVVVGLVHLAGLPGRWWRPVLGSVTALSIGIGLLAATAGEDLLDDPGFTDAPIAATLAVLFPTFVNANVDGSPGFALGPTAPRTTGRVDGDSIVAEQGVDPAGVLAFGPYARLHRGKWKATFALSGDASVCIDVTDDLGRAVLVARCVRGPLGLEVLEFETGRRSSVETRVRWDGEGGVALESIMVEPVRDLRPSRGWPYAVAWIAGLAGLAAWMSMRLAAYRRLS